MIARERSTPRAVHENGNARALGEGGERRRRAVPVDAAAGDDQRALGLADEPGQFGQRGRRQSGGRAMNVARRNRRQAVLDLREQEIDGDLDEDRPRPAGERSANRGRQRLGDLARLRDGPRALRDRPQQRHLLHLLEGAEAAQAERSGAPDEEHGTPRRIRVGDAGHRIGHARPRRDDRDAEIAGETRPGIRGMRSRLLVAQIDDADPLAEAAVVDRQDVAATQREHVAHARLREDTRDEIAAGQLGHGIAVTRISPTSRPCDRGPSPSARRGRG